MLYFPLHELVCLSTYVHFFLNDLKMLYIFSVELLYTFLQVYSQTLGVVMLS